MATKLRTVQVQCDHCPAVRQGKLGDPIARLRSQLVSVGWLCQENVDICPACLAKGVRR